MKPNEMMVDEVRSLDHEALELGSEGLGAYN
jgi:hypothetical protein